MLGQLFKRSASAPEERALMPFGPWMNLGGSSAAGVYVSPNNATQLLAVHGCVALITDTIATLPLCIYRDLPDGTHEEVDARPAWVKKPNANITFVEFVSQTLISLLLEGNAYWIYSVDGNGMPSEMHCVDPTIVDVRPATNDLTAPAEYRINGKVYRGNLKHVKGMVRPGALKGLSPIEDARQSIGLGLAAQEFAARFYSNGASLSGVIETQTDLTLDQARSLVQKFGGDHAGLRNAHKPGLLDNGATWKPLSVTPEQAQFLESRQFQTAEIAGQLFLIDPAWFGMATTTKSALTYSNRQQLGEHLVAFTLQRWLVRVESAISELLPQPQYGKFNVDELKRGDLAARAAYYTAALNPQSGWMERDEVRELEDLGPSPDEPAQPGQLALPGLAVLPQPQPAPTQPASNGQYVANG